MTKSEYAKYLQSDHWKSRRLEAIEAAESKCERCALPRWLAEIAYDQDLHVHHKTYANIGDEDWEDLEVLCRRCHDLETFGRSELRAPREATCEMCRGRHWNPRASFCTVCSEITGSGDLPFAFRMTDTDPTTDGPVWQRLIREMLWGMDGTTENVLEVLRRYIEKTTLEYDAAMANVTTADGEIQF